LSHGRRGRPSKARARAGSEELDVQIDALGAQGDGVLDWHGERLVVPLALPGESWRVRRWGRDKIVEPLSCVAPITERQAPVCRHFGNCGGCTLQHLPEATYAALLIDRIEGALRARELEPPGPLRLHRSPLGSRRRLRLGFTADGQLGFRRRLGRQLVKIGECPIARPALVALFAPLRRLLRRLEAAAAGGEVTVTALDAGPEVVLHLQSDPGLEDREALAGFAEAEGLVRLAIAVAGASPEPVAARLPPVLTVSGVQLTLPPAAFLQATAEGEAALQAFVAGQLSGARKVVDLFAGLGTLSLGLAAAGTSVRAFDGAAELIGACRHPNVRAARRDLQQSPLQPDELGDCDAVILDPPRAGALAQAEALAASAVPRLVYASCDPATFARDAAVLVQGGYRLSALEAVDQFLFAPDIELVAAFVRDGT
jgi:23S rRNA (uracil1939-C5)-methyltransferase